MVTYDIDKQIKKQFLDDIVSGFLMHAAHVNAEVFIRKAIKVLSSYLNFSEATRDCFSVKTMHFGAKTFLFGEFGSFEWQR